MGTGKHDTVKSELKSCCVWAGLQAICELLGLFGQFLSQQPLNRIKYRRTRVCLRPDFLFKLPMAADVQTITLGVLS